MRLFTFVLAACLASASSAELRRGKNLVGNPGFEEDEGRHAARWTPVGNNGYILARGQGRKGGDCLFCDSGNPDRYLGAVQEVIFDPPVQHPFQVSGWAKSEKAEGADFCLYMDVWYKDGTNLWGMRKDFDAGTHGWQYLEYGFDIEKPITKIQYFILFRRCTGKAWFDDVSLSLKPFKVVRSEAIPGVCGGNTIDYRAMLSFPATWTATVHSGQQAVMTATGHGTAVRLSWPGTDLTGRILPAGDYTVRLQAKDDLRSEELTHAVRTRTRPGPTKPYLAWVENSMKRVLVDDFPRSPRPLLKADILLAGDEYESFQVCLRPAPGRELKGCTVTLNDLSDGRHPTIPKSEIEWRQVGFVLLKKLYPHPAMEGALPGWWPDPLLPVNRFDVSEGVTQSIWFTVHAPRGTPGGVYKGLFTIAPDGAPPLRVPVVARVYGFDLPPQPHIKTAFALMDGFLENLYGKLTPEIRQAYGDYVLRHRLNPDDISRTDPPGLDDLAHYNGRGLNAFNVMNLVEPRGKNTWVCWSPPEVYTPEFKQSLIQRLDPYMKELKRRGLAEHAYVYTFDERGKEFYPIIKEYFGMVKERWGVPTLTTSQVPLDPEVMKELNVDWNCPLTPSYDMSKADQCRAAGLQVWAYVCCGPRFPYANWLADDPLIEARVLWWQAYHQKMDGLLYWGLNIWSRAHNDSLIDPEKDGPRLKWSITTSDEPPWDALHGDGDLLYAGKEGPIGCLRLENIRDGIEDYEYLWMLAQQEGSIEKARAACLPVTTSLTRFTREPGTLAAQRHAIASRLEARGKRRTSGQ